MGQPQWRRYVKPSSARFSIVFRDRAAQITQTLMGPVAHFLSQIVSKWDLKETPFCCCWLEDFLSYFVETRCSKNAKTPAFGAWSRGATSVASLCLTEFCTVFNSVSWQSSANYPDSDVSKNDDKHTNGIRWDGEIPNRPSRQEAALRVRTSSVTAYSSNSLFGPPRIGVV